MTTVFAFPILNLLLKNLQSDYWFTVIKYLGFFCLHFVYRFILGVILFLSLVIFLISLKLFYLAVLCHFKEKC